MLLSECTERIPTSTDCIRGVWRGCQALSVWIIHKHVVKAQPCLTSNFSFLLQPLSETDALCSGCQNSFVFRSVVSTGIHFPSFWSCQVLWTILPKLKQPKTLMFVSKLNFIIPVPEKNTNKLFHTYLLMLFICVIIKNNVKL